MTKLVAIKNCLFAYLCYHLIAGCYAHTVVEQYSKENVTLADQKPFSIDDVAFYDHRVVVFNATWISDKEIFQRIDDALYKFDLTTRNNTLIARDPIFSDREVFLSADQNYVLVKNYIKNINSYVLASKYIIYDLKNRSTKELANGQLLADALWAPKGSALVYVLNNDIYYYNDNGGSDETRRLTLDGKIEEIFNGITDWVYGEEVLGKRSSVLWFSPNGDYLVFPKFDDSDVDDMVISRYNSPGSLIDQYPEVVKYKYPKAGKPIAKVTLNLIDLRKKQPPLITLKPSADVGSEPILWAVDWLDDKTIVSTWTNRAQNHSQIITYSLDGQPNSLLTQETPKGWLLYDIISQPAKLSVNYLLLVELQSTDNENSDSYPHVIRYNMANGKLDSKTDLTPGTTWVTNIVGIDDSKGIVYYIASPPNEPSQKQLYQVNLRPSEHSKTKPKCISCESKTREGNACKCVGEVSFSKDFSHYALACSGPDPTSIALYSTKNQQQVYEWFDNAELRQMLAKRMLPKTMDLEIPANGFVAKVRLLLPVDFDAFKKYPMIVKVYGGPNSQAVVDEFAIGFEQYMTTRRQVIYAFIDGRGTNSKGTAMMYAVYRNLGNAEMEDQITVTRKLQEMISWIDRNRTGIWGRSYGGYSTATILTQDDSNVFKCGISVAPVTSWFYYDAIYTERYMGLPSADDNLKRYEASEVISNVEKLKNKMFMLVHGTGDDNVHLQQSMALSKALVDAGILFQQFFYPDEYHPLNGVYKHLYHSFDRFFSQCFGYNFQ